MPQNAESTNSTSQSVITSTSTIVSAGSTSTTVITSTASSSSQVVIPSSSPVVVPPQTSSSVSVPASSIPGSSSPITTPASSSPATQITSTVTKTPSAGNQGSTVITFITSTSTLPSPNSNSAAATSSTASQSVVGSAGSQNGPSSAPNPSVVAPAVVVPVIGVAIAVILGIFLWRRRKQQKEAAEMRQKEMEEYSFNPNNDPTIPVAGALSSNGDDHHTEGGGYRGWGTTSSAATRKASTTLGGSSAMIGLARSDSGGRGYDGNYSPNAHSPERENRQPGSPEGLGALGAAPLASTNRNQGVNRGISNASSAYSGAARSDTSDNGPVGFAGSPQYYDDLLSHDDGPHADGGYGQPVIRDVTARRNTRIENPAIFPQHGNAGIAQNF